MALVFRPDLPSPDSNLPPKTLLGVLICLPQLPPLSNSNFPRLRSLGCTRLCLVSRELLSETNLSITSLLRQPKLVF